MITIDPKTEFHRATTQEQRNLVHNSLVSLEVRLAMVFALSQMMERGATAENIEGAIMYRNCLMNIAEPKAEPPTFPKKELQTLDK